MSRAANGPSYWLTRFVILRLLGLMYFVAFCVLINQALPLIGQNGLLPAQTCLGEIERECGSRWAAFLQDPSLFWIDASDKMLLVMAVSLGHFPHHARCRAGAATCNVRME